MVLVTINKRQRLLHMNYLQRVSPADVEKSRADLVAALGELPPSFRLLADMSQLDYMDPDCAPELGRAMDLISQHGVGLIVRVIPDPAKDIGLNILAIFHYPNDPRIITCENLPEAVRQLSVWQ